MKGKQASKESVNKAAFIQTHEHQPLLAFSLHPKLPAMGTEFQTGKSKAAASLKASGATSPGRLRPIRHVLVLDKEKNNIVQSETCTSLRVFLIWKSYLFEVALPGCTFESSFQMIL